MKTTFDIDDLLYDILINGSLRQAITGKVYKANEYTIIDSSLEDVVIDTPNVDNNQLQQPYSNVNIFVPDKEIKFGNSVRHVANSSRMKQLVELAKSDLKDGVFEDYTWDIQQQNVQEDKENKSHYINIRLQFFVSNI